MSERKVLTKYYPPDFDPAKLTRTRGPKNAGPRQIPVRLMAPFGMKCTTCGEYIYKGRKFNARKETTEEKYFGVSIFRFYIRCTRCSAEITFKTDPKNMDYECEKGAKRNFEPWREAKLAEETEEERLDRLEREEAERDVMKELEHKTEDAKTEMAIADALDEVRTRNARLERVDHDAIVQSLVTSIVDDEQKRQDEEDAEIARKAFTTEDGEVIRRVDEAADLTDPDPSKAQDGSMPPPSIPSFKRVAKKKKNLSAALGIKKKPSLVS
jgi:hypothetical protein